MIDETTLYYTFSTIAQTLGGIIALLGAFIIFRTQFAETKKNRVEDNKHRKNDIALNNKKVALSLHSSKSDTIVNIIADDNKELMSIFKYAIFLTGVALTYSIIILCITPLLCQIGMYIVLIVGVLIFLCCLFLYGSILLKATKDY